ncbi:hypothetical protein [Myxococcus xanthus]|uniref:hypothetical protein n=1 Tax=Myxococcus xanthus TaxID=34 RepID=UPI001129509F|nr:hypothetical protein [Myxococcus xanthus]
MPTLDDLAAAQSELRRWDDAFANDRSNNPNKYEAQRRDAAALVRRIERELKDEGLLAKTEAEMLNEVLDRMYPNAKSKLIVSHNGKRYQSRYFPVVQSRSRKTVKEWGHTWDEV